MAATVPLADRLRHVALSPTMKGTIEAERLRRRGVDVVDLGAGEPDFATPAHILAAAHAALDAGFTKYTANAGLLELRQAVASRCLEDYGVAYEAAEVIITAGGKQALYHSALALFGPGDEVITHAPGWPTISEQVKLAGATPVIVPLDEATGFALDPDRLLARTTSRTRGLVLNSPVNPTGACLGDDDARRLAVAAARHGWWVVLDLCYDRLVFDVPHQLVRILSETIRDRLVLCGSTSKTYAMTGWRCGWMVAPQAVVEAAGALQSHQTSNVNAIAQKAAIAALTGPQECVRVMRDAYRQRRDALMGWLTDEPRLRAARPQGAFYLFPDVAAFLTPARYPTSAAFAEQLLRDEHVVVTAGEAFGAPGFLRLSYAASFDRLREGATRLIRFARAAL